MNRDNANRFADACVASWPNGVRRHVWAEIAADLDVDHARDALAHLRRNMRVAPTTAHMFDAHDRARVEAQRHRIEEAAPTTCEQCDGTGWVDAPEQARENSTAVKPCRCTTGQNMRRTQRRILDHNGTHLNPEHRTDPDSPTPLFPEDPSA